MSDFLSTFAMIVLHTPILGLAAICIFAFPGFQRTRDSSVPLFRAMTLPFIVTVLAAMNLVVAGVYGVPAMLTRLAIGSVAGCQLDRAGGTRRLPGGHIWMRGEWWSFCQLVMVMVFRYSTSVVGAIQPTLNPNPTRHLGTLGISAALSGLFLGQTAAQSRVYFSDAHAMKPA